MMMLPAVGHLHLNWETALDRLELDLMRAERLLHHDRSPALDSPVINDWDEPDLDGPVPDDLYERAVELRARQESLQAALASRLGTIRREHAFAARVERATGRAAGRSERPVYLDVDA